MIMTFKDIYNVEKKWHETIAIMEVRTYVAPSKFDTVLSIPESGISLHSISYEI